MNENLVFIRKIKQNGQLGSLLWDVKAKRAWFTPEILPKSRALRWLMWTVIVSGILVTPYWLFDKMLNLPHFPIHNDFLWWLVLLTSLLLPAGLWWFGRQKVGYDVAQLQPFERVVSNADAALWTWLIERLWVWTVLFLLPPTVALFIVLFVVKRDPLDALLIVLHAALFFRRAIPHAIARVSVSAKRILEG